jgi:hypothetical protein
MAGVLLAAAILLTPGATTPLGTPSPALRAAAPTKIDTWTAAYQRGDYATAATLLQRVVFEPPRGTHADAAALKQLALLYADGKGVDKDPVLACGLLRAHAVAASSAPRATMAAKRAAQAIVDRYCTPLSTSERAAAFAAMSCPRVGLPRGATVPLEPGWSIRFNDRSATVSRNGEVREQPLAGDVLCRSQVLLVRHSTLDPATGGSARTSGEIRSDRGRGARHVVELVTLQSGWRGGTLSRELVWQLYEVRGLALDLAAVQRWQEPGSAWPAPALPEPLARGVNLTIRESGEIEYAIDDTPPRRGTVAIPQARR